MIRLIQKHSLLCISLLITVLIYTQGLPGDFIFDDRHNIVNNTRLHVTTLSPDALWDASFSSDSGKLNRPVSMLSFALNHVFTGLDPVAMKITNIVIHLCNGILVYCLIRLLITALGRREEFRAGQMHWIPWIVTCVWLLAPYQISSVLYVVQRMTMLSAFFSLLGMVVWVKSRLLWFEGYNRLAVFGLLLSLFACLPLALLSKENGLLMVGMILSIEVIVLSHIQVIEKYRQGILAVLVSLSIFGLGLISQLDYIQRGFTARPFELDERLITQSRIIMIYLADLIWPAVDRLHFFHDEIQLSRTLLNPISGLFSTLFLLGLIGFAVFCVNKLPLVSLGIAFFFCGHLMESTIIPLELFYEHRNYLPSLGIFLAVIAGLIQLTRSRELVFVVAVVLIIIVNAGNTLLRAQDWSSLVRFYEHEYRVNPTSPRSNHNLGELYSAIIRQEPERLDEYYGKAKQRYLYSYELDNHYVGGLIGLFRASQEFKQTVDPLWFSSISKHLLTERFTHHSSQNIRHLVDCYNVGVCKNRKEFAELLDELITKQEQVNGYARPQLYWIASNFYFNQFQDKKSYQLLMRAHDAGGSSNRYIIEATRVAIEAGKFEVVEKNLNKIELLNLSYSEQEYLNKLKKKLKGLER